jgi:hypothetical protein
MSRPAAQKVGFGFEAKHMPNLNYILPQVDCDFTGENAALPFSIKRLPG